MQSAILSSRQAAVSMEFPTSQPDFHNPTNLLPIKVLEASVRKTSSMWIHCNWEVMGQ